MPTSITRAVGKGCKNDVLGDAVLVQLLLNHHIAFDTRLHKWLKPFPADGKINGSSTSDTTVTAIIIFQREILGMPKPDGRVDPGGRTLKALAGPIGAPIKPAKEEDEPRLKTADPVRLKGEVDKLTFGGSQPVRTSLGSFTVSAGDLYRAVDGERLVTVVVASEVVFALLRSTHEDRTPGVYSQLLSGFASDVTTGAAAADIVEKTRAIHDAIEIEMYLLSGIAVGISLPGALFMFTMSAGEWIAENKRHFPKWRRQIAALGAARDLMKKHAPTLYDQLFVHVMKDVASNIPAAFAANEKLVARTAGEWIGRLGKAGFAGSLLVAETVVAILWPAIKAAASSIPGAVEKSAQEMVEELLAAFRAAGRLIPKATAEKMRREVLTHHKELHDAFQRLHEAFEE